MARRWVRLLLSTVGAVALVGDAVFFTVASATIGYTAADQQQSGECDGVPAPHTLSRLDKDQEIVSAVVCSTENQYLPGEGIWEVRTVRRVPDDILAEMRSELFLPNSNDAGDACTAMLIMVGDFVITFADGSRDRPGAPGDGCHVRMDALSWMADSTSWPVQSSTRLEQVADDPAARANCGAEAKSAAVRADALDGDALDTAGPRPTGLDLTESHGSVSVCRYRAVDGGFGTLTAVGVTPASTIDLTLGEVGNQPSDRCAEGGDPTSADSTDFILLQRTPATPTPDDVASNILAVVELDGCRRLVDATHGTIGYLTDASTTQLAALADHPVG